MTDRAQPGDAARRRQAMRPVSGVLAGVALALLVITVMEYVGGLIFPIPALDWSDPEAVRRIMAAMPLAAKECVVGGWLLGALAGAALAVGVARQGWVGWVPAAAVLIGSILNSLAIPHPLWMNVGAVLGPAIGGALGIVLARALARRPAAS